MKKEKESKAIEKMEARMEGKMKAKKPMKGMKKMGKKC